MTNRQSTSRPCWTILSIMLLITYVCCNPLLEEIPNDPIYGTVAPQPYTCPIACACLGNFMDCAKKSMVEIPKVPEWVQRIDLTHNRLEDNDLVAIQNLSRLKVLKLSRNRLGIVPVLMGLPQLDTLVLSQNKIEVIGREALEGLKRLVHLDVSKNLIANIVPNTFPASNNIRVLNLNGNRLSALDNRVFSELRQLTELKMNHNRLTELPAGLFLNVRHLKKLELNFNRFTAIKYSTFSSLEELRTLEIRSNRIRQLDTGAFTSLKNITTLELDNNVLTVIKKDGLLNLTSLSTLSLSNNTIDEIQHDAWEFCQHLVTLDLSNNQLADIQATTFDCLAQLRELNLHGNHLMSIAENAFNCTANLRILDLSDNLLTWTIEDVQSPFNRLRKLQEFKLNKNQIKSISANAFVGLDSVEVLDLSSNNITTIEINSFDKMAKIREFHFNSSTLLCDCNMLWFYKWLQFGRKHHGNPVCNYPEAVQDKPLLQLHEINFTCIETPLPVITIEPPHDMVAIKGTTVKLECGASSNSISTLVFRWRQDTTELIGKDVVTPSVGVPQLNHTSAVSVLTIERVDNKHAGMYQCIVSNAFGPTFSSKIKMEVATYPVFRKKPTNITQMAGNTARLDCSAIGEPNPEISWKKDGGHDFPSARERRMHVMPEDHAFFIVNVRLSDMGVYTCTAENSAGAIQANATLIVDEPPSFVKPMENKEASAGTSTVLECMASGSPKPMLYWLKDGHSIDVTERHFFAAEGQLLIIVDIQDTDAGRYQCEMKNLLGTDRGTMELKVKQQSPSFVNNDEMTGIVIITVVACAVGTSIVWVWIIYQTKRNATTAQYAPQSQSSTMNYYTCQPTAAASQTMPSSIPHPHASNGGGSAFHMDVIELMETPKGGVSAILAKREVSANDGGVGVPTTMETLYQFNPIDRYNNDDDGHSLKDSSCIDAHLYGIDNNTATIVPPLAAMDETSSFDARCAIAEVKISSPHSSPGVQSTSSPAAPSSWSGDEVSH